MDKVMSEYEVESLFIERLEDMGYEYVALSNYDDVLANFRAQLCKVNAKKLIEKKGVAELSDREFDRVLLRLNNHTIYESAKILREQWILTLDDGQTVYLDFLTDDTARNTYQVTHQVTMDKAHLSDVVYKNRYDVTILVNGLPLVQVELKRPGVEINEAINQINRYRKFSFKGLFRYIQIFIVSNSTQTKYFANTNERTPDGEEQHILKALAFFWTDDENTRINRLMDFTNSFLPKFNLTEMLIKYFVVKESEPILMVMRPYQIYAVQRAFERIVGSNMSGYVFACTGSGKTLTSYKLATLLRDNRNIDKVFFLIDRKDLDDQTIDEYNSFEPDCVDNTENTKALVKALGDSSKTLIVTTIQKMACALRNPKYEAAMEPLRTKKCVFIIDECHRSQFGKMHGDIKRHFQKANYIGFTGTPIFRENKGPNGRTTADVFATHSDKVEPCIHKYMIKEAIADGNVLRFSVEYMRSINVLHADNIAIDADRLDDTEYCRAHGIDQNALYHADERIACVSDDILEHLEQHIHPTGKDSYTALFATDRIPILMKYYRYMKANNPKGYKIAAIFTYAANEDMDAGADEHSCEYLTECIDDYNEVFGTHYDITTFDAYRKDISRRMKQKDEPQIDLLLVVDMFLTGFDSKATNTLILDKNLVWHSLIQAYSRTNRVSKVTKQFGQIVTYRNIKAAQDAALKLYSGDGNPNDFLLQSYEYYVTEYRRYAEQVRAVAPTPDDAGYLQDEDKIRRFVLSFRSLSSVLSTLKTFSKFDWEDLNLFMDEVTYTDYKSWYLYYYDQIKQGRGSNGTISTILDVDFQIELVRTDKINVVYILNLLKEINRRDKTEMSRSVDLILREIERSDNEKMRYKRDIMKTFIQTRFFELDPEEDIVEAYAQYEKERMQTELEDFSEQNGVEESILAEILHLYFADSKQVSKEYVRQKLVPMKLGLLKITKLINNILLFVQDMYDKYTAEGV